MGAVRGQAPLLLLSGVPLRLDGLVLEHGDGANYRPDLFRSLAALDCHLQIPTRQAIHHALEFRNWRLMPGMGREPGRPGLDLAASGPKLELARK